MATVLDYGEGDGTPFIVMEFLQGETLAERLRRGPLEVSEAVGIAERVAAALEAAHQAGIVHRDVKPENIMLTPGGVKVMDFGIAAASWAPPITATGATLGTASYLAPEQALGERAATASDVYSLGVVLYEMLAGHPPFSGETPVAVAAAHVGQTPPPLRGLRPEVPEHVAQAVEETLAKDPGQRPRSAGSFAQMLRSSDPTLPLPAVGPSADTEVLTLAPDTEVLPPYALRRRWRARLDGLPRRGMAWMLVAALVGLTIMAAVLLREEPGTGRLLAGGETAPAAVTVPDVVGRGVRPATRELAEVGLLIEDIRPVEGPPGVVIGIVPEEGESVAPGALVRLEIGVQAEGQDVSGEGEGRNGEDGGEDGPPFCDTEPDHPAC